jgi:glycosyltransferase involved in cell wall biosynthesis
MCRSFGDERGIHVAAGRCVQQESCREVESNVKTPILPRVAIVSDTLDDINGVTLGLRRLAHAAARGGRSLTLVGSGDVPSVVTDEQGIVRVPTWVRPRLPIYPEMLWGVPRTMHLHRWLLDARIDIVQCSTPGPMGFAALAAARSLGLPVVAQYHTEVETYAARMWQIPKVTAAVGRAVGWFYRRADLCLAPSRAIVDRLGDYGVTSDRIAIVPRGTDLSLFHPRRRDRAVLARWGVEKGPTVLYVGRLSREKNLDRLLGAFGDVRRMHPTASLLLVGDGPYASALHGPGVVQTGWLTGAELAAVFASADVFAFPSETETYGNVVVEAQAAGLPVIVAAAGAAHETVVPGITGQIVDMQDSCAFAAAIQGLLDCADLRQRMGAAAHKHAQRFDLDAAAERTFALYRARPFPEKSVGWRIAGGRGPFRFASVRRRGAAAYP